MRAAIFAPLLLASVAAHAQNRLAPGFEKFFQFPESYLPVTQDPRECDRVYVRGGIPITVANQRCLTLQRQARRAPP